MIPYILKTLQKEEYVFIERLGAFRTQLKHAVIEKNVIHPPYNEVVFSQNDSEENNFALANLISREKKCLFTEANEQIMRWVDELLVALRNNKSVTYEGFGTFMLDKKGNISFESAVVPQLNSQFEGMEPIDVRNIGAYAAEPEPDNVETFPETSLQPETEDDEAMKVVETVEETEPEPVVETETVVEAEDDETKKVVETVEETEPEPVVETEPVAEPEDDEAKKDDEAMKVVETVEETEPEPDNVETFPETSLQPELKDDETMKVEEPVTEPEPVGANNDSPEEEDDNDEEDEDDEDEDDEKKRHGLAWLWVVLLLLVALGALGFVFKDKITSYYHQWKDKKQPVEQEITPETTEEETQMATFEEEPVVEEEVVAEETPEVVEEKVPEPVVPAPVKATSDGKYNYVRFEQGRYYVIVGSFPTESDAEKHIRNKRLGQYSPVLVKQDGVKNLRVCIGVFDTEAAAEQFAKTTNQNYWILK